MPVHENDKRYLRLLRQFRAGSISKRSTLGKIIICDAMDEEVWRTTEEGKHFKFDNETGEIKAGFGGKHNGKKLGGDWKKSGGGSASSGLSKEQEEKIRQIKADFKNRTTEQISKAHQRISENLKKEQEWVEKYDKLPESMKQQYAEQYKYHSDAIKPLQAQEQAFAEELKARGETAGQEEDESLFINDAMTFIETEDGGPGSGNFGHRGRPGEVGGSGKGGGKAYRTGNKESGYVSIAKAKAFQSIAANARNSKDYNSFVHSLSKEQQQQIKDQHSQSGTKESLRNYTERLRQIMSAPPAKVSGAKFKLVEGSNIAFTYKWDAKAYTDEKTGQVIDTEIEDVIHKQGFDGVPKVVSQEEFDRIVKEHPEMPILLRSFSAPDADTLHDYDKQLEEGAWYVDCGTGGAQYGQGMYAAGVYGENKDLNGAMEEMRHYRELNEERCLENFKPSDHPECDTKVWGDTYFAYDRNNMKSFRKNKPEDGQLVVVRDEFGIVSVAQYRDLGYGKGMWDGQKYDMGLEFSKGNDDWTPLVDSGKVPIPASSTRMMTLDPSAKIISYRDLQDIRNGRINDKKREEIKQKVFENTYKEFASLSPILNDDRVYLMFRARNGMLGKGNGEKYVDAVYWFESLPAKDKKKIADEFITAEVTYRNAVKEHIQRAEAAMPKYSGFWDMGSFAAAMGYDAINSENHGRSGSYTVVLNRTKVILSDQRVKVER